MEIQTSDKYCIITPLTPKLDKRETERIRKEIAINSDKIIGLNLDYVQDCTIDFLEIAKDWKAGLFNIQSDVFSLLTLMNLDKYINLYTTEEDFITDKHQLLNRKFTLVS